MDLDAPGLENAHVRMEPFGDQHRHILHESGAVDAMWNWMPVISTGTNYDSYFDHVLREAKRGQIVPFAMYRPSDGAFLGVAAFQDPSRTHRRLQVAHIWLTKPARGKGIFVAAQALMIKRALEWGARRIVWLADERNEVAIGAFKKLGAQREGIARSYQRMTDGHWADMVVFSMLRIEAKAAVKLLEERMAASVAAD